jgi:hypothetical protein
MTKEQFISNLSNWNSYLPLLWEAIESTKGSIIELGMGEGSTVRLHEYAVLNKRHLYSFESNREWYDKFCHLQTISKWHSTRFVGDNWDILHEQMAKHEYPIGVLFSDEAPGEMRKYNISMFCNVAQVVVAHDTEIESDGGYKFSLIEPLFKYKNRIQYNGTDTCAFSNFIDVSKWSA